MSKSDPCAARESSFPGTSDSVPAKRLRLHDSILRTAKTSAIAPVQNHVRESADESGEYDSCNMRAAEWLATERFMSGMSLEDVASLAKVSTTTVWRRENGLVDLGPLKQMVKLIKRGSRRGNLK